jgi:hypothetical protein
MKLLKYTALIAVLCAAFTVQPAKAIATTTFDSILNFGNDAGLGLGPYGTVDVSLTGQTATITFTADAGFFFVDGSSAAVNLSTSSFTHSAVATETPVSDFKDFTSSPPPVDGLGNFSLIVDNNNASVKVSTITFTVTNSLATWVTASDVLAFNAKGFDAAAHIFSTGGGITGFAGENGTGVPTVPDSGTTAMLLGGALAGLGVMRRLVKR